MGHSGPLNAPLVLVGRDYGFEEQRAGRPFVGPAGKLLTRALAKAGIEREQCLITNVINARPNGNKWEAHTRDAVERGTAALHELLARASRACIVALGAEAFQACRGRSPFKRPEQEFDDNGITELRGYVFEGPFGPVLASTHPAFILRTWLPWWPCLCWDLAKAKRHTQGVAHWVTHDETTPPESWSSNADQTIAVDIETAGPHAEEIVCVGFAWDDRRGRAVPFSEHRDFIMEVLASPARKVFHNGQFDVTILERHGLKVNNWTEDTMLAYHCLEPLIAGKSKNENSQTQKSLRFLASILTDEPFWKLYSFESEEEQLRLCARDARITWACWDKMQKLLKGEYHERHRNEPM